MASYVKSPMKFFFSRKTKPLWDSRRHSMAEFRKYSDFQARTYVRWTGMALAPLHIIFLFTDRMIAGTYDPHSAPVRIPMTILLFSSGFLSLFKFKNIPDRNLLFFQSCVWMFGQCANVYYLRDHSSAIYTVCLLAVVSGFLLFFETYKHALLLIATFIEYIAILVFALHQDLTSSESMGHIAPMIGTCIAGFFVGKATSGRNYREWSFLKRLEENNRQFQNELRLAEHVQRRLLPNKTMKYPNISFDFRYLPASSVGGDMLDIIAIGEHRYGLMIADVSGHGVSSALISSMLKMSLYSQKNIALENPSVMLSLLNKTMLHNLSGEFITAIYATVDSRNGSLCFATAGHENPIVVRNGDLICFDSRGRALGISPEKDYTACDFQLQTGDIVFFFTDGCFEILDEERNVVDMQRFYQLLVDASRLPFESILDSVIRGIKLTSGTENLTDDATILLCAVTP